MPTLNSTLPGFVLAASILALAVALGACAWVLAAWHRDLPELLRQAELAAAATERVAEETAALRALVPEILAESGEVRRALPPVLAESARIREEVPAALAEAAALREALPATLARVEDTLDRLEPALAELRAWRRETVPAVLEESAAIRTESLPRLLEQVALVRAEIPAYLDHADALVEEIDRAGQRASEGAVRGLLTGVLRAPFTLVNDLGRALGGGAEITEEDRAYLAAEMLLLLESETPGTTRPLQRAASGLRGSMTLVAVEEDGDEAHKRVHLVVRKGARTVRDLELHLVRRPPDGWELLPSRSP